MSHQDVKTLIDQAITGNNPAVVIPMPVCTDLESKRIRVSILHSVEELGHKVSTWMIGDDKLVLPLIYN